MTLNEWAERWSIAPQAFEELRAVLHTVPAPPATGHKPPGSESAVQQKIRLAAPGMGLTLWRNNNGACQDMTGRLIRYGLANDSHGVSQNFKSSDLIGVFSHTVTAADVGRVVGRFISIECKKPGWKGPKTPRENAQNAWNTNILALGGIGGFATSVADVQNITGGGHGRIHKGDKNA